MKKHAFLAMIWSSFLFMLLIPIVALAEGSAGIPDGFLNWETLATFGGAVSAVVFLVQMLKLPMDRIWKIPTQVFVYVVSLALLIMAQAFVPSLGGLTWQTGLLCLINAVPVALSAMAAYDITIGRVEQKKAENTEMDDAVMVSDLVTGIVEKTSAALAAKVKNDTAGLGETPQNGGSSPAA